MSYRERRLRKADRLRKWADGREAKSAAAFERARVVADGIPMGQPILVGHHSERRHRRDIERIDSGMRQGVEHQRKAVDMRSRAAGIEDAAERAIYSDDPDAPNQLSDRIMALEALRARMKTINREIRKGPGWAERIEPPLTDDERKDLASAAQLNGVIGYPAYALSNLSGNIARQRKRLDTLRAVALAAETGRRIRVSTNTTDTGNDEMSADLLNGVVFVKCHFQFERKRLSDILCAAVEGGSGYWAYVTDVKRTPALDYISVTFHEREASETGTTRKYCVVDLDRIAKGIARLAASEKYFHHFADLIRENDDACTADVIVQLAMFEDVIYG